MRQATVFILIALLGVQASADTTNRALQVSPVPGVFVGGVGLLCNAADPSLNRRHYFLLTKGRTSFGWADFSKDDDINYNIFKAGRSPDFYQVTNASLKIAINRKTLRATISGIESKTDYECEAMSITDLHNAAKLELQNLLQGNRI